MLSNTNLISETFVKARLANQVVSEYPGDIPADLDSAYVIQDAAITLNPDTVSGWKVGRIGPALAEKLGSDRLAGPIFSKQIIHAGGDAPQAMPVLDGFAAVEAELMLRIRETPPADANIDSIRDYIDEVRIGIEIASSPFPGINDHGPTATVSDYGNNFGLLLGPEISDWRERDLMNAPAEIHIEGALIGTGILANMLDGPFGSVVFLNKSLPRRGRSLNAGDWISTGAITGVHQIHAGMSAIAKFDNQFQLSVKTYQYEAAQ
jgi:2-keto-4-pentenoate hydratase